MSRREIVREIVGTLIVVAILAVSGWVGMTIAYGTTGTISIDTIYFGDDGDLFFEGTIDAAAGDECVAVLASLNPDSIHPDSDILVGPVTFFDVEADNQPRTETKTFTATGPVDVHTRLGGDGIFSAGFTLEVTCNPPTTTESTTTTTALLTTTTTAQPVITAPPVTTTTPPPPLGVNAGGGSTADDGSVVEIAVAIIVVWAGGAWLAWALVAGGTRRRG
jgi:hypothetical protein